MENCLVTKLKGTVDNPNLKKLNRLYVKFGAGSDTLSDTFYVRHWSDLITDPSDNVIRIESGTGVLFWNGQESQQLTIPALGQNFSFGVKATTDISVSIPNKYALARLFTPGVVNASVDAEDMKYLTYSHEGNVPESITCYINGSFDVGIIEAGYCYIDGNGLYGDATKAMKRYTGTWDYMILFAMFNRKPVIADFSQFAGNLDLNINTLATNVFPWKSTRTGYSIPFRGEVAFNFGSDLDAMLINQANLNVNPAFSTLIMNVAGTKTSASDSAVATLKSKGFDVKINGEQM